MNHITKYVNHPGFCNQTCRQGHICAISKVTTQDMNECLEKGNSYKPPRKEISNISQEEGLSSKGRFIAAGVMLAVGLLAILITIVTINIRYNRISRQLEYNILSD